MPENHGLKHRRDAQTADAAYKVWCTAADPLNDLAATLASDYFSSLGLASMKAELAEMDRLGISESNYRGYLNQRKSKSPGQVCRPLKNREWLRRLANGAGNLNRVDELLAVSDAAEASWRKALSNIRRYSYKS